jgi:hypothetical protein
MRFRGMFLVSFDRDEVPTHKERVHLLLKFCYCVEFFNFLVSAKWAYPVIRAELLKGQSHEKVDELRVWGVSLGPN